MTKENIIKFYEIALLLIQKAIKQEKKNNPGKYSNADFFKSIRGCKKSRRKKRYELKL